MAFRERMKALILSELDTILRELQAFCGRKLQEVIVSNRDIALQFHSVDAGPQWIVIDLNPKAPSLWSVDRLPFRLKASKTPLLLFLKAHFKGKILTEIKRDSEMGRVVHFNFQSEPSLSMEIRLLPHGQNILLASGDRKLSLKKVQVLEALVDMTQNSENPGATYEDLQKRWIDSRNTSGPVDRPKAGGRDKKIKKLGKSLAQLKDSLDALKNSQWQQAGEKLVQSQDLLSASRAYPEYVNVDLGLSANIQTCFERHKRSLKKIAGAEQRIKELEAELFCLQSLSEEEYLKTQKSTVGLRQKPKPIQGRGEVRARKHMIADDLEFLVGRSAKDNMGLIRRARAWDCWLHLQDFPSAHGILFRNRNRQVTDREIHLAARFLVETYAGKNKSIQSGEAVSVIWTEARYVHPIKGDKLGRVTYKNTQSLVIKF